ncbi:hypothetical protein HK096_003770 [Nowakowskiella sp. JEL0078]|nr:hypothetical protein HK096_003770 [Nowakowskiella sp. JEL0078]
MPKVLRIVPATSTDIGNSTSKDSPKVISISQTSYKRLMRDVIEIQKNPYPGISFQYNGEINKNKKKEILACLVLNPLSGPFKDIPLHFKVIIPEGFPDKPPKIEVSTAVKHPHVYGGWICADILNEWTAKDFNSEYGSSPGYVGGYTSAYTLFGVALQMLCFFTNETLENDHGHGPSVVHNNWNLEDIMKVPYFQKRWFKCEHCNYNGEEISKKFGNIQDYRKVQNSQKTPKTSLKDSSAIVTVKNNREITIAAYKNLFKIPVEIWLQIANHLSSAIIIHAATALPVFRDVLTRFNILTRRELNCFFSKATFLEDVLGFGVHVQEEGSQKFLLSEFEFLSNTSFNQHRVRRSVWKKPFEFFIPFAICNSHFLRSLPVLRVGVRRLGESVLVPKYLAKEYLDRPNVALQLLVRMMNNVVVSLFRVAGNKNDRHVLVAASEKAVEGYISLLHLVLSLVEKFPVLVEEIEERVADFMELPKTRLKSGTPDIGEWLIYLGLSERYRWSPRVAKAVVPQFLSRNVMWMLRREVSACENQKIQYPYIHLALLEADPVSQIRMVDTFTATSTSLRLLLFQVFFLTKITRPLPTSTCSSIYTSLESRLGRPEPEMLTNAFYSIKEIQAVSDFYTFFKLVGGGYEDITDIGICKILKQAIIDSDYFGYHRLPREMTWEDMLWYQNRAEERYLKLLRKN